MKEKTKRIITAIFFVLAVILILVLNNKIVDTIFVTLISLLGIHEYNNAFKAKGHHPISWIGYLSCFGIFLMGGILPEEFKMASIRILLPLLLIIGFIYITFNNEKYNIIDISITIFSLLYIPFMFSFLKLLMLMENSRVWLLFAILGASISDTCAYEVGSRFGKRKLSEKISPKKTIEGSVAGIIGAVVSYIILALVSNHFLGMNINLVFIIIMGIVVSIMGQFGDLSASLIKRYCGIKDFGTIMPGHGGILDRFDSLLFTAPMVYVFVKISMLLM
ncbi:MAG: phosphatidate cytidylyltransferase [Clostridia bacterium]|nr:phosphatidate cytidylyltransferase [Clostridia bacterium]